jgi:hypothetical protein
LPRWLKEFGRRLFRRSGKLQLKRGIIPNSRGELKKTQSRINWMWY